MLLQTNSYIVPKEKRAEHSRLIRRFRQTLLRLGCDHFEVYEQVGANWSNTESAGRYVQILRFLDRKHQLAVQAAERTDPTAQAVIADFCNLINFPYQQQQGLFAVGFYTSVLPVAPKRGARGELVSTVEHEVIDDPEAEMPYPGSSDEPVHEENEHAVVIDEPMMTGTLSEERFINEAMAESTVETSGEMGGEIAGEPIGHTADEVIVEPIDEAALAGESLTADDLPAETVAAAAVVTEHADHNHTEHVIEADSESADILNEESAPLSADDDFMSLVGGDLRGGTNGSHESTSESSVENPFDEEADDDRAHGFIEAEVMESHEHNGDHTHDHLS